MRYRLTPEYAEQVVRYIRAGGYDWVASEAAGVPRAVFESWLRRGADTSRQPYRRFFESVMQARAQARLKAEIDARNHDPRFWLKHGPGREQGECPGWTNPAKAVPARRTEAADPFASPQFQRLIGALLTALSAYPEARLAAAASFDEARQSWRGESCTSRSPK